MIIKAFNKNKEIISELRIVDKYIDQKRWDVLSAGITRLIHEIQSKGEEFSYTTIGNEKVILHVES